MKEMYLAAWAAAVFCLHGKMKTEITNGKDDLIRVLSALNLPQIGILAEGNEGIFLAVVGRTTCPLF